MPKILAAFSQLHFLGCVDGLKCWYRRPYYGIMRLMACKALCTQGKRKFESNRRNVIMHSRNIIALLLTVVLFFAGCQSPSRGRADDNISATQALQHNSELRKAHQHTVITEDWGSLSWLAGKNIGNAEGLVLGRATIKPGKTNPRHRHPKSEEVLYLLKGSIKHTLDDRTIIMHAGDTITIAPGVFHNASCISEEDADMIVVYSEGIRGFELE